MLRKMNDPGRTSAMPLACRSQRLLGNLPALRPHPRIDKEGMQESPLNALSQRTAGLPSSEPAICARRTLVGTPAPAHRRIPCHESQTSLRPQRIAENLDDSRMMFASSFCCTTSLATSAAEQRGSDGANYGFSQVSGHTTAWPTPGLDLAMAVERARPSSHNFARRRSLRFRFCDVRLLAVLALPASESLQCHTRMSSRLSTHPATASHAIRASSTTRGAQPGGNCLSVTHVHVSGLRV